ncbi:tetratricopeptide repeat protein [bacterium]|nr:tetratricopeptide repeat protein [bacterium]
MNRHLRVLVCAGCVLLGAVDGAGAAAPDAPRGLTAFGLDYEAARLAGAVGDRTGLESLARALDAADLDGLSGGRRDEIAALWGAVHAALGQNDEAGDAWRRAADRAPTPADRAAALFRATESAAAGLAGADNEREAELWRKWLAEWPESPLAFAAELRLAWIHLREQDPAAARAVLDEQAERRPWAGDTPPHRFARAMAAYLESDPATALALVEGDASGPAPLYLAALCRLDLGQHLQAAAAFQQVTVLHPGSALHDRALFAKANTFLNSRVYRSAAEDFARVAAEVRDPAVRAEAELRRAAAIYLDGDLDTAVRALREVVIVHEGTDIAARGQFLLGEVMVARGDYPAAIVEYTQVLTHYFDQSVAASAQYRLGRCYAAMNKPADATAAYMAVVAGYPQEPEAPAAAYLAGNALLDAGDPRGAVPYFQIVLDRYAADEDGGGTLVFASADHQELVEAALCMLEVAWHRTGDLGQLTGAPHTLLVKSPPSRSSWRAWTVLIDADAMASQGNYAGARAALEGLRADFPLHPAVTPANQLLAWTYAQQGEQDLAIATSEQMLDRYTGEGDLRPFSQALLNVAHVRFNQGRFEAAVEAYEEFLGRYPGAEQRLLALYQAGLCYLRLDRGGDAIDRWEAIVRTDPDVPIAEKAWARAGDLYFQAESYADAKRCYQGLLDNFRTTQAAALGQLRIAQCDYNAGADAAAVAGYEVVVSRFPDSPLRREADKGIEMALYRMGQREDGVAELGLLLEKYPRSSFAPDAQFQIANRLYETDDFTAAADEYRRVVSNYPGYASADRAQFLMAESLEKAGAEAQAGLAYEQFLGFFGESDLSTAARFRLGMNHFQSERYAPAAESFAAVLAAGAEPEIAKASLFNLGLCTRLQGDLDAAAGHFTAYRDAYPRDERVAEVNFQLGDTYDRAGRVADAIAAYRAAILAKPDPALYAETYYRMGGCFEKSDNRKKAIEAYALASRGGPAEDPFRLSAVARCAVLYEDAERYEDALASYRDLMNNAADPDLVAAASGRAAEIAAALQ